MDAVPETADSLPDTAESFPRVADALVNTAATEDGIVSRLQDLVL